MMSAAARTAARTALAGASVCAALLLACADGAGGGAGGGLTLGGQGPRLGVTPGVSAPPASSPGRAWGARDDISPPLQRLLDGDGAPPPLPPLPELAPPAVAESTAEGIGAVELSPTPWDPQAFSRDRKRMDIDQLARAFEQFDGGVGWRASGRDRWREQWAALGGPNFITRVTEDRRPSVLFTKLIRDAAMEVCVALVARELPAAGSVPQQRTLITTPNPAALPADDPPTREAVAALLWRAHGVELPLDDPEVGRWVSLLAEVALASQSAAEAWRALCVAALVHPRFWSY